MEPFPIEAYHITDISNIPSIVKYGLSPSYGKNSRTKREQIPLLFFTTFNFIDTWIKRFNLNKQSIVILKFICKTKYLGRYDHANDLLIDYAIPSNEIFVVVGKAEIPLQDYYQSNKEVFDLEATKIAIEALKQVMDRLKQIESTPLTPEKDWDYNECEPNLIATIDALKNIISLDNKSQFLDVIKFIKDNTLRKLIENDLEITKESAIYRALSQIFDDVLSANPELDFYNLTCATNLISINMFYRQLNRYNRTTKKYGDDYTVWQYDDMFLQPVKKNIVGIPYLNELLEETKVLHERHEKGVANKKY